MMRDIQCDRCVGPHRDKNKMCTGNIIGRAKSPMSEEDVYYDFKTGQRVKEAWVITEKIQHRTTVAVVEFYLK